MSDPTIETGRLDIEAVKKTLAAHGFGANLHYSGVLASTSDRLIGLAGEGHPQGTVVIAEHQTAGRGRQGRSWHSPAGLGLYLSLLLRPGLPAGRLSGLTLALGVSAAETAERISGIPVEVKWPNDLYCRGRKTGGILTELHTIGWLVQTVVVGLGLNVNNRDLPPELSPSATSLSLESGKHLSREQLLAEMLGAWEQDYGIFLERGLSAFAQRLEDKLMLKGREVQVECGDQTFCGLLAGCDQEGGLLLTDRQGGLVKCLSGTLREVIR